MPYWKRSIDLMCCLVALPVLSIFGLFMVIITKAFSPGPIFFRQERIGLGGRKFKIYKFRTMHLNSEVSSHATHFKALVNTNAPMMKLDNVSDRRLIFGCWLLRASGLDELPQMINVFRGEMSLVGPRPCLPIEYELFQDWQKKRCIVVPGLTGLWQVSGKNRLTFEQMIQLDVRYARTRSFSQDIKIILMTAPALIVQIIDTYVGRSESQNTNVPFDMTKSRDTKEISSASPF